MIELRIADAGQMEAASTGLTRVGSRAADHLADLTAQINGLGACWGGDEAGQAFWSAYADGATATASAAAQVGPQLQSVGDRATATLRLYQGIEESAVALTREINQ